MKFKTCKALLKPDDFFQTFSKAYEWQFVVALWLSVGEAPRMKDGQLY